MGMQAEESIAVRRPERWSEPMDASMTDADVAWLCTRQPFAEMDPKSFPRSMPLSGILRNDCRIQRCEPGQIVVREGDYGNSAFLVLAGSVTAVVDSLSPQQLGRSPTKKRSWIGSLYRSLFRAPVREARQPSEVTTDFVAHGDSPASARPTTRAIRQVDDRPAIFLQDCDAILAGDNHVTLGPGEMFGEVAAMYRSPRTATVVADTEATLLEIRWQGLKIFQRDKKFAAALEQHYRGHWLPIHLREIPLLRHLSDSALAQVAEATQLRSYGRMEWNADYHKTRQLPVEQQIESEPLVADEGKAPTDLLVVRSGFGRLSQHYGASHRTTAYLGKGHLYGLAELAYNALRPSDRPSLPLQHSLRAVGFFDLLVIPAETFVEHILPQVRRSELPDLVSDLLRQPKSTGQRAASAPERRQQPRQPANSNQQDHQDQPVATGQQFRSTELLEFIVQHRLNNGRQAMVIDLHRCTRCDDCVKACAATHDGNPRFVRHGFVHDRLQFAHACMQCDDPVCMIGCPTGAIARDEPTGVIQIHESICVGCGTCAHACPYNNIRMVEVFDSRGRAYLDQKTGKPIAKATKCDMCNSHGHGPACAAACPHDALVRIDLTESPPLQSWLDQRS
jgi:Fe-S-cluster-containing dehydrogenase component/CRP-like cAMP-binding protein